jgi:hypothetical protein
MLAVSLALLVLVSCGVASPLAAPPTPRADGPHSVRVVNSCATGKAVTVYTKVDPSGPKAALDAPLQPGKDATFALPRNWSGRIFADDGNCAPDAKGCDSLSMQQSKLTLASATATAKAAPWSRAPLTRTARRAHTLSLPAS